MGTWLVRFSNNAGKPKFKGIAYQHKLFQSRSATIALRKLLEQSYVETASTMS